METDLYQHRTAPVGKAGSQGRQPEAPAVPPLHLLAGLQSGEGLAAAHIEKQGQQGQNAQIVPQGDECEGPQMLGGLLLEDEIHAPDNCAQHQRTVCQKGLVFHSGPLLSFCLNDSFSV